MTLMPEGDTLNLSFPEVDLGERATGWDLRYMLYKGGSAAHTRRVSRMITQGELGQPICDRLALVQELHGAINDKLVAGGSMYTAKMRIRSLRDMFAFADKGGHVISLETAQKVFLLWTDSLVHRHQVVKNLKPDSAYQIASGASDTLDIVLKRESPLISVSRLRKSPQRKTARGVQAEKQNLSDTFAFGELLQDICDGLPIEVVLHATLPVRIPLRRGGELIQWSGCPFKEQYADSESLVAKAWESDGTLRRRFPLSNRRCEAELLMFIGQTGMNFAQAHKLRLRNFTFASYLDGYLVRERKARRGGDVLFEIYREYKPHFERYLEWRRKLFPECEFLFPFLSNGSGEFQRRPQFALRPICNAMGMRFVPPRLLRNTRVNWLFRRSGDDDLTASMAQHSKQTLLRVYERPSQQRAMSEITRFWSTNDPTLVCTAPPAPGQCNGEPAPLSNRPKNAPTPDCIRPSGCLWCDHHRDIDSPDYVWALASFRHLKIIEVSKWNPPHGSREVHPAQHVIDRITEKLRWFRDSNPIRKGWMEEAVARIDEGNFHPDWAARIEALEGAP